MSLYQAFNRSVERNRCGIPSVRITPAYKIFAEEAAIELRKEIKIVTPSVAKPVEIKKLVAESHAALLSEEVLRLRGILSETQGQIEKLMGKFEEYREVTAKLAEEMGAMQAVRKVDKRIGAGRGKYLRDLRSVTHRWSEWRKLYFSGMNETQIANRYGVDRGTIAYAKSKNWVPSYSMSGNNHNHNKERKPSEPKSR